MLLDLVSRCSFPWALTSSGWRWRAASTRKSLPMSRPQSQPEAMTGISFLSVVYAVCHKSPKGLSSGCPLGLLEDSFYLSILSYRILFPDQWFLGSSPNKTSWTRILASGCASWGIQAKVQLCVLCTHRHMPRHTLLHAEACAHPLPHPPHMLSCTQSSCSLTFIGHAPSTCHRKGIRNAVIHPSIHLCLGFILFSVSMV